MEMERQEALELVKAHVKRKNLFKHILAVEAIMRALAAKLNEDVERWGLVGLLHDVDFDETFDKPELHANRSAEILDGKVDDVILRAVKSHNFEHTGVQPESKMEIALIAADAVSGLVVACALVMPSKKLAEVKPESVTRRLKEKDFARNCSREHMLWCEKLGLQWPEFAEMALNALQGIHEDLGL